MKSICKVLALCLCFGLVISMCACKGGGGGSSSSSSSGWTTGKLVANYVADEHTGRNGHNFAFMDDGVVGFFDHTQLGKENNDIGNPWKTGTWDKTKDHANDEFEVTVDGKKIKINKGADFTYTCPCGTYTYKKQP